MTEADSSTEPSAEAWLRQKDGGIRIIAAEMAEYAGRVNVLWSMALNAIESYPDTARAVGRFSNVQTQQSERYSAVAGASYRLSIRMKPGGASRWVGFCFYTSDVPLHNNENRLSCEIKKAPSFDGPRATCRPSPTLLAAR